MFERFSPEARDAVSRAGDEARGLGHGHIGTEHLLLGLIGATGTTSAQALIGAGAFLLPAREKVIEALAARSPRSSAGTGADLPYTDRAARALDRSGKLALRMGSEQVRCEHILLSVLDVEGTAGQVLRGLGVDPEVVRSLILSGRPASPAPAEPPAATKESHGPRPGPICASCGSTLATSLGRAAITIAGDPPAHRVDIYYCTVCGTAVGARSR